MPAAKLDMITSAFVQQFHDSFEIAAQQKDSRLQSTIKNRGNITGTSFTINDMGDIEMQEVTSRFADTVWNVPEAGTRMAVMADYNLHVPVELTDLHKLIAKPQGEYMQAMLAAKNRKIDDVIFKALTADVLRKDSDKAAYAPVAVPASQKIAANGKPFGREKIVHALQLFRANECDQYNGEKLYIAYNSTMLGQILNDDKLTNHDYMQLDMLKEGKLATTWLGATWIPYEKLVQTGNAGAREFTTVMWAGSALHFGTGESYKTDIGPRRDKNNTIQISARASYGAGRANEKKVVPVSFIE